MGGNFGCEYEVVLRLCETVLKCARNAIRLLLTRNYDLWHTTHLAYTLGFTTRIGLD